jgi:hypothetical protein
MMEQVTTYEFAAEFRGDGYTWHPSAPADLHAWETVLGHCLRHQISPIVVETSTGRRWSAKWTPTSHTRVRGGSLQIEAAELTDDRPAPAVVAEPVTTLVAALTAARPWRLTSASWRLLQDPGSELARAFASAGLPAPEFAILSDNADVAEALRSMRVEGNYVVIDGTGSAPSAAGQLLLEWMGGESWLAERIGPCQGSWVTLLEPATRDTTLAKLQELIDLRQAKIVGWERSEQVLTLLADVASRWSGSSPKWSVTLGDDLKEPELDIVTGSLKIPFEGRRARKLAMRAGAPPTVTKLLSAHMNGNRYVSIVLALGIAFALGGLLGFWSGYLLAKRLASEAQNVPVDAAP